jgi:hypothetical protein
VFNAGMYRLPFAALAVALVLIAAAPASAKIVEVGDIGTAPVSSCPASPCEVISRTTAYQTRIGTLSEMFTVPADGRIVAWTITLGKPGRKQLRFFEENLGGPAQAGISVLKPGKQLMRRVTAVGPLEELTPYFGQTVQFPLGRALNVKRGYMVALTVPTWAPALTQLLEDGSSWRASRPLDGCDDTESQTAQMDLKDLTQYRCLYRARLTYSATLVTNPRPNPEPERPRNREQPPR